MNNPNCTTHADRVAGWIVLCVAILTFVGMLIVATCPRLSAISQSQLLGMSMAGIGILGGAFNSRRANAADSSQQVTIPSGDAGQPAITVSSRTGSGSPAVSPVAPGSDPAT